LVRLIDRSIVCLAITTIAWGLYGSRVLGTCQDAAFLKDGPKLQTPLRMHGWLCHCIS